MSEKTNKTNRWDELNNLIDLCCKNAEEGYQERWKKLPLELYDSETYEVIAGLMARQATLKIFLANSPNTWNGHIAPLILRSMIDAHITLAWILKNPKERAKQYILYSLGETKLQLDYYKAYPEKNKIIKELINMRESWLSSQINEWLVEVNVGSWSGKNVREMAKESDSEELYQFPYKEFSQATHNTWKHISGHNLKPCTNSLHKYHRIPTIMNTDPELDYVYRAIKYLDMAYQEIDSAFNLEINTKMPLKFWAHQIEKIFPEE